MTLRVTSDTQSHSFAITAIDGVSKKLYFSAYLKAS